MNSSTSVWVGFAAVLLVGGCVDRSLGPLAGDPSGSSDGASVSSDASTGARDLSSPPATVDLAVNASPGVACGNDVCMAPQSCCLGQDANDWQCSQGMCGTPSYRCDGPEDCAMGRLCVGSDRPDPGFAPQRTRCRNQPGPGEVTICHTDADCGSGGRCQDAEASLPNAPPLRTCIYPV